MKITDELLRQAIKMSGYYNYEASSITLDDSIDISIDEQVSILLARELKKYRPDLFQERNKDILYMVCNNFGDLLNCRYSLPSEDLTSLMENEKPFDDSYIVTYSLSEKKILSKLYKGDGTRWVFVGRR